EDRLDSLSLAQFPHPLDALVPLKLPLGRDPFVTEAEPLELAQVLRAYVFRCRFRDSHLCQRDLAQLLKKPRIHAREASHFPYAHPALESIANITQPLRPWSYQHLRQPPRLQHFGAGLLAGLKRPPCLHQRFLEGPPHRHHFAHRLHLRAKRVICSRNLLELPLGNFHHDIIDRRLKARRRFARNVVWNLVQRVTHSQLRRNLRNRKSGSLRSQRRRPRNARIHLNHRHAPVHGVHRKLHVRSTSLDADLAHNRNRGVTHLLVLAIGERLRRSNSDRVPRMHAHGIKVFNRADDNDVVRQIAHYFKLVLFPAQHALFEQALMYRRKIKSARQKLHKLFAVISNAAARAAQRKARPNQHRKSELRSKIKPVAKIIHQHRFRNLKADANHRILEQQPVLSLLDRLKLCANQLHVIAVQNPRIGQIDGQIQRRLPAHRRQQRKLPRARLIREHLRFNADDLFNVLTRQRLNVCAVGKFGIGHDGGRVRIHQHHLVALLLESLARLRPRVVELRRLPDHDRPRANHQDLLNVISTWHLSELLPVHRGS